MVTNHPPTHTTTTTILDLPNEILLEICILFFYDFYSPEDDEISDFRWSKITGRVHPLMNRGQMNPLVALSLTCKRLRLIAQPVLFHCIKWIWEPFPINSCALNAGISFRLLLRSLEFRPDLARQVHYADLSQLNFPRDDRTSSQNGQATSLSLSGQPSMWSRFNERKSLAQSALLSRLKNVRHIKILIDLNDVDDEEDSLDVPLINWPIADGFQMIGPSTFLNSLVSLTVNLNWGGIDNAVGGQQLVDLLVGMPNLTTLMLTNINIDSFIWSIEDVNNLALPPAFERLKKLLLYGFIHYGPDEEDFLRQWLHYCKQLEIFEFYNTDMTRIEEPYTSQMSVRDILSILEMRAFTLKRLVIEVGTTSDLLDLASIELCMFQQLQCIKLDWSEITFSHKTEICLDEDALCQALLPPSIERIELRIRLEMFHCLIHIVQQRKEKVKFSRLREICVDIELWKRRRIKRSRRDLRKCEMLRTELQNHYNGSGIQLCFLVDGLTIERSWKLLEEHCRTKEEEKAGKKRQSAVMTTTKTK